VFNRKHRLWLALAVLVAVAILATITLAYCTNRHYSKLIKKELLELQEQGYPTKLVDLNPPAIPDSMNGAINFREAASLFQKPSHIESPLLSGISDRRPADWSEEEAQMVENHLSQNTPALESLDNALAKPQCIFITDYSAGHALPLSHITDFRSLARLLALRSSFHLQAGRYGLAIQDSMRMARMSSLLEQDKTLISSFVAMAIEHLAYQSLRSAIVDGNGQGALSPEDLLVLKVHRRISNPETALAADMSLGIDLFENPRLEFFKSMLEAFPSQQRRQGEKPSIIEPIIETLKHMFDILGPIGERLRFRLRVILILKQDEYEYVHFMRQALEAIRQPYPVAKTRSTILEKEVARIQAVRPVLLTGRITPVIVPFFRKYTLAQTQARLARTGIAVELYRNEHGHYPGSLDDVAEMVGEKDLEDPFGAVLSKNEKEYSQTKLIYRREGDSYVLYSIEPNMKDDGGVKFEPHTQDVDIVWRGPITKSKEE